MKLDLKIILPYVVIIASLAMTWGMWSERLEAVEKKADSVTQMQQDIAITRKLRPFMAITSEELLLTRP